MPVNKHALIRYHALDKCFGNRFRRYYIDDLIDACNEAIYEFTGKRDGVKRRQVFADIAFMESPQGWDIPLERIPDGRKVYYRYSKRGFTINDQPLTDTEIQQLRETIVMLSRFKGMPGFEWMDDLLSHLEYRFYAKSDPTAIIGFEQNQYLQGIEYLTPLFNAIVHQQVVRINYQTYRGTAHSWDIHPYYIKQYNSRWFLFGMNDEFHTITNIPLDRITKLEPTEKRYIPNKDIDFSEYFSDVIGVTIPSDGHVEKVLLRFTPERFPYVVSKPLHESQRIKDSEQGLIEISVIPNKELESLILSFGNQVEVLSPASLRHQIKEKITDLCKKYSAVQIGCTDSSDLCTVETQ